MQEKTARHILKKVVKDYSSISKDFSRTRHSHWTEFESFLPYIKNGMKIADLACGNGRFYDYINRLVKIDYLGIDNNKKLLQLAGKKHQKAKFIYGDLLNLPIEKEQIDLIVSIAALHHIPTKKLKLKALKEMIRVLKKNSVAIITVWNLFQKKYKKYVWFSRFKHIVSFGKYESRDTFIPWGKTGTKRYYYAFKANELEKLAKEAGFTIISQEIGKNIVLICKKS